MIFSTLLGNTRKGFGVDFAALVAESLKGLGFEGSGVCVLSGVARLATKFEP